MRTAGLTAAVAAVVAGCGNGGGGSTIAMPPATGQAFCQQIVDHVVAFTFRCRGGSQSAIAQESARQSPCAAIGAALDAGRMRYNRVQAPLCLAWIDGLACNVAPDPRDSPCTRALTGVTNPPASCRPLDLGLDECASGNRCAADAGACGGVCTPYIAANDGRCASSPECAPGTDCINNLCLPVVGVGAACANRLECADGLVCDGEGQPGSTCRPKPTSGAGCLSPDECAPDAACAGLTDTTGGFCTRFKREGEPCTVGIGECGTATRCLGGTCTVYPGPGAPCGEIDHELVGCLGSTCQLAGGTNQGTCTAIAPPSCN